MTDSNNHKRKAHSGAGDGDRKFKRSRGGKRAERWKTPHQITKEKTAPKRGLDRIQFGDQGIWITCVRGKEGRAVEEARGLFEEYAQLLYNTTTSTVSQTLDSSALGANNTTASTTTQDPTENNLTEEDEDEEIDIESSIAAELSTLAAQKSRNPIPNSSSSLTSSAPLVSQPIFTSIHIDLSCLLFFQVRPPVTSAVEFVTLICRDAASASGLAKGEGEAKPTGLRIRTRYINRLTPMSCMGRATEKGLLEVAGKVLREEGFVVKGEGEGGKGEVQDEQSNRVSGEERGDENRTGDNVEVEEKKRDLESGTATGGEKGWTYAIRPSIRAHQNRLTRSFVIQNIAALIDETHHRVDLSNPDKIILVEVFQTVCGVAVVDGGVYDGGSGAGGGKETEKGLKKFNLWELWNGNGGDNKEEGKGRVQEREKVAQKTEGKDEKGDEEREVEEEK